MQKCFYQSPIGEICIEEENGKITGLFMVKEDRKERELFHEADETEVLKEAKKQLEEYFNGIRKEFCLPLNPDGTTFQRKVWEALQAIPYGQTRSYGEIAAAVGNKKASRAVGGANHKNPIMIVIPCHRVIGANGSLTGFGGGLEVKQYLLNLEKLVISRAAGSMGVGEEDADVLFSNVH